MKNGVLTLLLIFSVSSSQAEFSCIERYIDCSVPLINNWNYPVNCSLAVPLVRCITNVSGDCDANVTPLLQNFENMLGDICDIDDNKRGEWKNVTQCVAENANTFKACTRDLPEENHCYASIHIVECTSFKMHEKCGPFAGEVVDKLMYPVKLLADSCVNLSERGHSETAECLMNNSRAFRSCKLTGDFRKMRDMCSSIDGFTQCIVQKSEETCGQEAKREVVNSTEHITFALRLCKDIDRIGRISIPECDREIIKCNVDIFNVDEPQCADFSKYVGCLADATKKCEKARNGLLVIVLEKYKSKFPEYCDKDSSFNKNMQKEEKCIDEKTNEVLGPCYKNLQNDKDEVTTSDVIGNMKAYVNFLHCIRGGFEGKCNKEAGDAVNDLLHPLGDSLDESCRILTGKRCNSACGLQVVTWIFLACLTYLLTRKHE